MRDTLPNGRPFPPAVQAKRAKHAAKKAAHPERYLTRQQQADRIVELEEKVKDLEKKL